MAQVNLSGYKNIYLQTAKEYVNNLLSGYLSLSTNSQDADAMKTIHLSSHSLKSQSQVMGFTNIVNLCVNLEKVSDDILNGVFKVDVEFTVLLKKTIDELSLELASIEKRGAE